MIERGNSEQEQAIAARDSSVMRDTSAPAYYQELARSNQAMLDSGVTAIKLITMDEVQKLLQKAKAATYHPPSSVPAGRR